MNRDLLIGILVAFALHGGIALSGHFFTPATPPPPPADEEIPFVELAPLPPEEPELAQLPAGSSEAGGGSLSDLVPPMQTDTPSPSASSFVQRLAPPPPPGLKRGTALDIIPSLPPGIGAGQGAGFANLFDLANLDEPPAARTPIRALYPASMNRAGLSGEVLVGFIVDAEGNVVNPYVIRSSHRDFEAEALRAVSRTKFKPGRKNGVNVGTQNVQQLIRFTLSRD